MIKTSGQHKNIRLRHEPMPDNALAQPQRVIGKGEAGYSPSHPITAGALHLNPGPGEIVNVYVLPGSTSFKREPAPSYTITHWHVYVTDGPDSIDIICPQPVLGLINIITPKSHTAGTTNE